MKRLLFMVSIIALLSACASPYPLGMSEDQWNKLTPAERKTLLLEQQKYREQQRLAQLKAEARQRELELKRDIEERKRLKQMYNNPHDGNVIMVNILGGEYRYGKRVKRVMEDSHQIARGEIKQIELLLEDKNKGYTSTERAYLRYDMSGNGVYLYLDNPRYSSSKRIAMLRDGGWACGSNYRKSLSGSYEQLIGMQLFVKESGSRCRSPRSYPDRYLDQPRVYKRY